MNDFAERVVEEQGGAGEVEGVFGTAASGARSGGWGSAEGAKGREEGGRLAPTIRADGAVLPLKNARIAENAGDGEEKIEDGVEARIWCLPVVGCSLTVVR